MRIIFIIGPLILILFGCKTKNEEVSPVLMSKLENIIEKYQNHEKGLQYFEHRNIYQVNFIKAKEDCFILISVAPYYFPEDINSFIVYRDNLIIFQITDAECNKYVNIKNKNIQSIPSNFNNADDDPFPFRSIGWIYKVVGDSLVIYGQGTFPVE